jgi:hypothetical protein
MTEQETLPHQLTRIIRLCQQEPRPGCSTSSDSLSSLEDLNFPDSDAYAATGLDTGTEIQVLAEEDRSTIRPEPEAQLKQCRACNKVHPISSFRSEIKGEAKNCSSCRAKQKAHDQKHRAKVKSRRKIQRKDGHKECRLCHKVLPTSMFQKKRGLKEAEGCSECRNKQVTYNRKRRVALAKERSSLKDGKAQCSRCQKVLPIVAFQTDGLTEISKRCLACCDANRTLGRKKYAAISQENVERDDGMKTCQNCRKVLPISMFQRGRPREGTHCSTCSEKYSHINKERRAVIVQENVERDDGQKTCTRCHKVFPISMFQSEKYSMETMDCSTCRNKLSSQERIKLRVSCPVPTCVSHYTGTKYLRLDKHMPIHETRDIKCPESSCSTSEKLYNEISLKYHINHKHKRIKLLCGIEDCTFGYTSISSVQRHQFIAHGINEGFDVPTGDDDGGRDDDQLIDENDLDFAFEAQYEDAESFEPRLTTQVEADNAARQWSRPSLEHALTAQDDLEWKSIWQLFDEVESNSTKTGDIVSNNNWLIPYNFLAKRLQEEEPTPFTTQMRRMTKLCNDAKRGMSYYACFWDVADSTKAQWKDHDSLRCKERAA